MPPLPTPPITSHRSFAGAPCRFASAVFSSPVSMSRLAAPSAWSHAAEPALALGAALAPWLLAPVGTGGGAMLLSLGRAATREREAGPLVLCSSASLALTTLASAACRTGSRHKNCSPQLNGRKLSASKRLAATARSTPHEASGGKLSDAAPWTTEVLGSSLTAADSRHSCRNASSFQTRRRKADMTQIMPGAMAGAPATAHRMSYRDSSFPEAPSTAQKSPPPQPT
mmetsp:Transcript_65719/g.152685  ORF Transcript_65719/g.152685 Transcript_65719/m.152685 type:complete len:227 (-) Transcript_65719:1323-2003(-)